jgi:hypothetical protein
MIRCSDFITDVFEPFATALVSSGALPAHRVPSVVRFSWPAPSDAGRHVYIAQRRSDEVLKIGISDDPAKRIVSLRRGDRGGFTVVGVISDCAEEHERALLTFFAAHSLPIGREWFALCDETRSFAAHVAAAMPKPERDSSQPSDAVPARTKLADWMKRSGVNGVRMAEMTSQSPGTISRWLSGVCFPDLVNAVILEEITDGAVAVTDWLSPSELQRVRDVALRRGAA